MPSLQDLINRRVANRGVTSTAAPQPTSKLQAAINARVQRREEAPAAFQPAVRYDPATDTYAANPEAQVGEWWSNKRLRDRLYQDYLNTGDRRYFDAMQKIPHSETEGRMLPAKVKDLLPEFERSEMANRDRAHVVDPLANNAVGRFATRFAMGPTRIGAAIASPFLPSEMNDEIQRGFNREIATHEKLSGGSLLERSLGGAGESLGQVIAGGQLGKAAGIGAKAGTIALMGLTSARQAYTEGGDAGLKGGKRLAYAGIVGAAEAGFEAAGLKVGMPGFLRLLDEPLKKAVLKGGIRGLVGHSLRSVGRIAVEEAVPEAWTQATQNIAARLMGVDPNKKVLSEGDVRDIFLQSLAGAGLIHTAQSIASKPAEFVARDPEKAAAIAALPETPNRRQVANTGVVGPSTVDERKAVVAAVKTELAKRSTDPATAQTAEWKPGDIPGLVVPPKPRADKPHEFTPIVPGKVPSEVANAPTQTAVLPTEPESNAAPKDEARHADPYEERKQHQKFVEDWRARQGKTEPSQAATPKAWPSEVTAAMQEAAQAAPETLPPQPETATQPQATEPQKPVVGEGQPTSIKNAVVDQERAARGFPPADAVVAKTFGNAWNKVKDRIAADPSLPDKLQAQLAANPRAVTDEEDAILLHQQVTLQSQHRAAMSELAKAEDSGNADAVANAQAAVAQATDKLLNLYNVNKSVGTETGRGLAARKMLAREDFTLANMEVQRRAANGGKPLTPEQAAEVKQLHDKIAKLQKEHDDYVSTAEEKLRTTQAALAIAQMVREEKANAAKAEAAPKESPKSKKYGAANKLVSTDLYQKTVKELSTTAFAFPAFPLDKLLIIGAYHVEAGARSFADFSARMIQDIGERVRPVLRDVYDKSLKQIDTLSREKIVGKIKEKLAGEADGADIGAEIQKLARQFVSEGIHERNQLIDAVHNEIKAVAPEMTRRDTMDAISGYGKFKQLTKDEVSVKLRDLKGQMQQVGKIEDMQAKEAPKKTGIERRTPSDEERRLIKEVNELKKKGGYVVTDPATQLRTALNAAKTRLTNQIADLTAAIQERAPIVSQDKTPLQDDAETAALRKQRDELKAEYDSIFGTPGMSESQRLKNAEAAAQRSLERLNEKLADAKKFQFLKPGPDKAAPPKSAKLAEIRAQQDAVRAEIEELRAIAHPDLTDEQRALKGYKARTARRIADLTAKTLAGDFSPKKPPVEFKPDDHATALQQQLEATKRQWAEALFKDSLANESFGQKTARRILEVSNFRRALKTAFDLSAVFRQGGFFVVRHPIMAAKALPPMFRALKSEQGRLRAERDLHARQNYVNGTYKRAGLFLSEQTNNLTQMEEAYMSRWANKPIMFKGVDINPIAASQRAYTTFLNEARATWFDAMQGSLESGNRTVTSNDAKIIANAVNVFTGRGSLGVNGQGLAGLNIPFWAPSYVLSRFQALLGQPIYYGALTGKAKFTDSAQVRGLVAKEWGKVAGGLGVVLAMAAAAGFDIEKDPRSSDFLKIKVGNTRIDFLAGISQTVVFMSRMISGKTKKLTGEVSKANEIDVAARFARSKLSPDWGMAVDLKTGKNYVGDPVTPGSAILDSVTPLAPSDVYKAMESEGVPKGTAIGILSIFGAGVQTYKDRQ